MRMFLLISLTVLAANAQQPSGKTEVPINGKIYIKTGTIICNKSAPVIEDAIKSGRFAESYLREMFQKHYLLNKDSDVKEALRKAIPDEILDKYAAEKMTIDLRIGSDGKVYHVNFFVEPSSPLYDMDIKIYSDLEDIVKSTLRFRIPDENIPAYSLTMPPFALSQLKSDKQLFSPGVYKERA